MKYTNTVKGTFVDRPNRFVAHVLIDGRRETVHVKNTGRCGELLLPGADVVLERSANPARKTAYDLISVYKRSLGWVNMDSQAPNRVAGEYLETRQEITYIKPECRYGDSRMDFYFEKGETRCLMEVKGVTLEREGTAYFPDAPTLRGVKHIRELQRALAEGYESYLAFVIQMEGIRRVLPNDETHPQFGQALREAAAAGVKILYLSCGVTENELWVRQAEEGKLP